MRLLLHSRLRRGDPIPICIGVPQLDLPGFLPRLARSLIALTVIGGTLVVNAAVTTFATAAGQSYAVRIPVLFAMLVINVALFFAAFRALTPGIITSRPLFPGAGPWLLCGS